MKELYDQDHRYTDDATTISTEAMIAVEGVMYRWIEKGYSPRHIAHLIMLEVMSVEMSSVLEINAKSEEIK